MTTAKVIMAIAAIVAGNTTAGKLSIASVVITVAGVIASIVILNTIMVELILKALTSIVFLALDQ